MFAIFVVSAVAFIVASCMDASTSVKFDGVRVREATSLYRGPDGKFVLWRYVVLTFAVFAIELTVALVYSEVLAAATLVVPTVLRFRAAIHNRKIISK